MKILKLFPNCIPVKGYRRSIIFDLHTNKIIPIPNILFEILTTHENKTIPQLISHYGHANAEIIEEYFAYLKRDNLIQEVHKDQTENYPKISRDWHYPAHITNGQLEYNNFAQYNTILNQLNTLNCQLLQTRYDTFHPSQIEREISLFNSTNIANLELVFTNDISKKLHQLEKLLSKSNRITKIFVFDTVSSKIINKQIYKGGKIVFLKNGIEKSCGHINPQNFNYHPKFFTESQKYNSCLNRKVCIDKKGDIKNCLYMDETFGNIATKKIKTVLNDKSFTKYWEITKDDIEHCSNCEFRYICMDCRAFRMKTNLLSQPKNCTYNPYIAKWPHEEGYHPIK